MKKRFFAIFCMMLALGVIIGAGTASAQDVKSMIEGAADGATIIIPAGTYTATDINVSQTMTIQGAGAGSTIIQAGLLPYQGSGRVFIINAGASVTIEGVTIQNGKAPNGDNYNTDGSGEAGENGGGILNNGTLTLKNCTVQGNAAGNGYQGAPGKDGPKAGTQPGEKPKSGTDASGNGIAGATGDDGGKGDDGEDGHIGGNGGNGGAIYNSNTGTLTLENCDIKDNKAGNGQLGGNGGKGNTGGTGGKGGDAGNADLALGGIGGIGGIGGEGGIGGIGGIGGKGGDGGSGGGIYNANIMSGESTCTYSGNTVGVAGTGGTPGGGGDGGKGGNGGYGGWSAAGGVYTVIQGGGQGGTGGTGGNSGGYDGFTGEGSLGSDGTPQAGGTGGSGGNGGAGGTGGTIGDSGRQPIVSEKDYVSVPSIITEEVTDITETTAVSGGTTITAGGTGLTITKKGVCWSTIPSPTAGLTTKTDNGTGTTDFTAQISGLTGGETYYVRAYATNNNGLTGYGEQKQFKTPTKPAVLTVSVNAANGLVTGNIVPDGVVVVTARGICWSETSTTPNFSDTCSTPDTTTGSFTGDFTKFMTGLGLGKTYNVSAYATNSVGTTFGSALSYYNPNLPVVTTDTTVIGVTATDATVSGEVTSNGGSAITERGICWSKSQNPTIDNSNKAYSPAGTGAFSVNITGLDPFTLYYARAYAKNGAGPGYGADTTFKTLADYPTVTTGTATNVTSTTALLSGTVVDDGGELIEKGVCWSKSTETFCEKEKPDTTTGYGISVSVTGLTYSTTYFFKAYAKNSAGTRYGVEVTFATIMAKYPKVTTDTVTSVTLTSAKASGTVEKQDDTDIDEKGFCWNTVGTPVIPVIDGEAKCNEINCITSGVTTDTTITDFSATIEGFTTDEIYYIRAYAKNTRGIAYGSQIEYKRPGKPTVTTAAPASIGKDKATLGGEVISTGEVISPEKEPIVTITARGVCYSTLENPSLQNGTCTPHTSAAVGKFTIDVTGLTEGTKYYVKAYTTSSLAETAYGEQKEFTTSSVPVVTTVAITNIAQYTATAGGEITSKGGEGESVTARGICWSNAPLDPTPDPAICTTDGTGIGAFTHSLTGLTYHTTYYVKAYATNGAGTGYGVEEKFETKLLPGDVDGDEDVDLVDAVILLKVLTNTDPGVTIYVADANGDNKLGIEDVIFILRKVLGL